MSKLLQCPPYLRPRLYTPTAVADRNGLGSTRQLDLGCFLVVPPAPSWCVYGCNRPIGRGNADSHSAAWSRVCGKLPIPLSPQLSLGAVLKGADLRLAVCSDQEATNGKPSDSESDSVRLVCKHID
jgi:hypothetical protein